MRGAPKVRSVVRTLTALAAIVLCSSAAAAQNAVITGRVTSTAGQPLGGASVGIPELGVGSIADANGNYTFTVDVASRAGRMVNIMARYIGHKPKRLPVTLTAGRIEHNFVLERDILNLEEVVVTGTSDATALKKTAFSVGVVDNTQIKEVPGTSPLASLEGKIPGASLINQSGQPGAEPAIRLRAATSLTGRTDPLIIIDGVLTNLGLADVNTEDIERVEVIKGAAASSLYGSNAANGVVQLFTKRGATLAEGQTIFTTRSEYGVNNLPNIVPGNAHHPYLVNNVGGQIAYALNANGDRQTAPDNIADRPYPRYFDQFGMIFKPGDYHTNYVSVGQRRGTTNFNDIESNPVNSGPATPLVSCQPNGEAAGSAGLMTGVRGPSFGFSAGSGDTL